MCADFHQGTIELAAAFRLAKAPDYYGLLSLFPAANSIPLMPVSRGWHTKNVKNTS